jgi:hypothetical protein
VAFSVFQKAGVSLVNMSYGWESIYHKGESNWLNKPCRFDNWVDDEAKSKGLVISRSVGDSEQGVEGLLTLPRGFHMILFGGHSRVHSLTHLPIAFIPPRVEGVPLYREPDFWAWDEVGGVDGSSLAALIGTLLILTVMRNHGAGTIITREFVEEGLKTILKHTKVAITYGNGKHLDVFSFLK